ncbi:hypothetical protein [Micromonospora sp. WMMD964]|uniref:hypothetical protein n=1 Tax=Micromonospora sp. WMMD964 TaxID=3016091 RepID=UPI00249AE2D4|nr:hypothetical protein [Micromonospora sp. WMMD964]WFF02789.1 hypothetical protein O7616_08555 [Micromonospora sp. WMMD964]
MPTPLPAVSPTRRGLLAAATLVMLGSGACAEAKPTSGGQRGPDPELLIDELTASLSRDNPYRDPDTGERAAARRAARSLVTGPSDGADVDQIFDDLGFRAHRGTDPATGRPFDLYLATGSDDRAWGAVLVDRSATPGTVIEVPHPGFDINTEKLGLAVHRKVPASVLLVAGAHRQAAGGDADVAHNDRSLFHTLAAEFAKSGLDQIQLHGFADRNLPSSDAVVSTGSAPVTPVARRIADGLSGSGLSTCRAWAEKCGQLEGKTNEQGRAAAALEAVFIHLELSWSVRRDAEARSRVATVLAEQLTVA